MSDGANYGADWATYQAPEIVQTDGWRWCIRHGGPIHTDEGLASNRCMAWFWEEISGNGHDEPGKCVSVPMYIDAEDP